MSTWTVERLRKDYERGLITGLGMANRLEGAITRAGIDEEMKLIPPEVMTRFKELVENYKFGEMILINCYTEPTKAQIAMLREWFARNPQI